MSETTKDEELFGAPEAEEAPPPAPEPEPQPEAEAPAPEAPEADDDEVPPAGAITPAAFAAARRDWKAKAIRAEEQAKAQQAELERLRAEYEQLRKAPQQPVQQQPVQQQPQQPPAAPRPPPDPREDPHGYTAYMQAQVVNERFNISEALLRSQHQDVDEKLAVFQAEAQRNPALLAQLNMERLPWHWMYQQAKRIEAQREIGDDPQAFRSRLEEEIRAKVIAEMQASQPAAPVATRPAAPVVPRGAPSLANATAVAGRDASTFTGDTPMSDILPNNQVFGGRA